MYELSDLERTHIEQNYLEIIHTEVHSDTASLSGSESDTEPFEDNLCLHQG